MFLCYCGTHSALTFTAVFTALQLEFVLMGIQSVKLICFFVICPHFEMVPHFDSLKL